MDTGMMFPPSGDERASATGRSWSIRFLSGQRRDWGEAKSQWRWIGKGELSIDGNTLRLSGNRHRYFWFAARQDLSIPLARVCNVVVAGRLVKFDVQPDDPRGHRVEVVRLNADDLQAAQALAALLPTRRTDAFDRVHHEKIAFERSMEQLGTQPVVTTSLVIANIAWFVFVAIQGGGWVFPDPGVLVKWGSDFGPLTLQGEWWRTVSSLFVHFGAVHLLFNMWALWSLGRPTERMYGSTHFALLYVLAGLSGSLASLWWHPAVNSAGASGAIFGVMGGLLAFVLNPVSQMPPTVVSSHRKAIVLFIAYALIGGLSRRGIDNAAHLGGLLSGFAMGWVLARPLDLTTREQTRSRVPLVGLASALILPAIAWHLTTLPHPRADFAYQLGSGSARIKFYPGDHRRVVFDSGEQVTEAMQAVRDAQDPQAQASAIAAVQQLAAAGDEEAAFRLGRFYDREISAPDYGQAAKYYRMAADKNHAWATNNLGALYVSGRGVPEDKAKARELMQKAADGRSQWAYLNLADAAFRSRGSLPGTRGVELLEQGGKNQCTMCYVEEAAVYHTGAYGIARDSAKMVTLLNKAAALGEHEAKIILAELSIVGDGVPQSASTAFAMLKTLSDDGDAQASTLLGELSSDDKIRNYLFASELGGGNVPADLAKVVPQDTPAAIRYWERATGQGGCQAWVDMSSVYDRGLDVNRDLRKGADDVEHAVRCDPANSYYLWKYAMRFFDARGRDHDCRTAEKYLQASFDHGYDEALINMGYIYDKGCAPIERDDRHAFQVYLLGAKLGVPLCENNVGAMLKHGRGVDVADPARGYGWIKLAALDGNDLALANLQDALFTPSVRAAGMLQFAEIKRRLHSTPRDPRAIMQDPWF